MSDPFIAEVKIFAGNFAPRGWAFCNGQILPLAQNTALFALIGTAYGGDGRTTLGLPNLQGRAPMHHGNGPGLSSRRLAERAGQAVQTLDAGHMPLHGHGLNAASNATQAAPGSNVSFGPVAMYQTDGNPQNMAPEALEDAGNAGAVAAHNNLQPYLTLSFIIALTGIFPTRN